MMKQHCFIQDRKSYFEHLFHHSPDSESAQVILTSNARGKHEIKSFNEELFQIGDCQVFGHFMRDEYGNLIDKNGNPVKWDKFTNQYYDVNGNTVTDSRNLMANPKAEIAKEMIEIFFNGGRFKMVEDQNGNKSLKRLEDSDHEKEGIVIPFFEERNPYFHVVYCAMHIDEWHGTPHIHIDHVPVGTGYVKGPEKQVGFERALANMGFTDKNTAYKEWQDIDILAVSKHSDKYLVGECKFKGKPFRYSEYLDTIVKLSPHKEKAEFYYYLFSESGFDEKIVEEAEGDGHIVLCDLVDIVAKKRTSNSFITDI